MSETTTTTYVRELTAVYRSKKKLPAPLIVNDTMRSPEQVAAFIRAILPNNTQEHFFVLHLNGQHALESWTIASSGLVNSSQVHPREVFKIALMSNAVAVVIGHNHPGGSCIPSDEDRRMHARLVEAGKLLGVTVLDDLIISDAGYVSLK